MKKWFPFLILIALLFVGGFYLYYEYMPRKLSEAIIDNKIPGYVPEKMRKKAQAMKKAMDDNSGEVIDYLDQNEVSLEEFSSFIDDVKYRDVEKLIEKTKTKEFTTPDEAFDFVKGNFDFGDLPIENFRDDFIQYYDEGKLKLAIAYFEVNKDQMQVMFPVVKETLKKVLEERAEMMEE